MPSASNEDAPVRLDEVDRRILEALRENARIPNNRLAELAGVAPSTCLQRVRALQDSGVIRRFTVDLDPRRLGYGLHALVSVRITPGARGQLAAFAEQLRSLPEVTQFFYLAGAADFIVHFQARTSQDLRDFVTEQLSTKPIVASTNTSLIFE
ncbi:MAG: Lrp/AsnC family transcriptional regulator, partial [Amnibacterium sp.]